MPCADNAAVKGLEVFAHQKIGTQPQFREGCGKGVVGVGWERYGLKWAR